MRLLWYTCMLQYKKTYMYIRVRIDHRAVTLALIRPIPHLLRSFLLTEMNTDHSRQYEFRKRDNEINE